jgi:DUF971 family protein
MKRIFYFTGHRFAVLHWSGKTFMGTSSFEPTASGLDQFEKYLLQTASLPTKLLIDVIEEDFRQEIAPHVGHKDRAAVVGRMLDRFYRSSKQFTYYEVIGREKTGRKDDQVLLGAITDPSLILPWLDVIDRTETPLAGIWTLPLVSKKILKLINATKGPVLLVSQQVNSTLRQTFFRDGKMISSRQSVINQDANNLRNIGKLASPEIDRTTVFLNNQHLINENEELQVHVLCSDVQVESLKQALESDGARRFSLHRIEDVQNKIGIHNSESNFSDGIYAWLCLTDLFNVGHYGEHKEFRRYYYSLVSTALYVISVAALVIAAVMTEANISSAIEANRSVELLKQQEIGYKKVYSEKFSTYEAVFKNARSMNAAVDLANTIRQHATISPLDLYIEVSKVLSQPQFKNVSINRIDWKSEQHIDKAGNAVKQGKLDIASPDPMWHIAVLTGDIPVSSNDYSRSVAQVNDIVLALLKDNRIEIVEALEMPVEVRSDKQFSAESGSDDADRRGLKPHGRFSIRIVMKGRDHV